MFEDKTLVCKECGKEFVFTAGEQEFYAARPAVTPARMAALTPAPAPCTRLPALLAARLPACPSSPARIVLCTAATASLR